jgi:hypothetical protein
MINTKETINKTRFPVFRWILITLALAIQTIADLQVQYYLFSCCVSGWLFFVSLLNGMNYTLEYCKMSNSRTLMLGFTQLLPALFSFSLGLSNNGIQMLSAWGLWVTSIFIAILNYSYWVQDEDDDDLNDPLLLQ